MMTRIVYDTTGKILYMGNMAMYEPQGVPCLDIDVPLGKNAVSIDVSVTPNVPIYEDIPKSKTELLQEQVDGLTIALAEMMGV